MSKRLILAEKPSVGKEIARVLNCKESRNGYIEGKDAIVTWAFGHLVTLGDPEIYDEKYKHWVLEDLPILPDKLKTVVIGQTGKQYQIVKSLMLRNDIDEIVIATDAGREGELVARWIIEKVHVKKPIKRLWISSVTDQAIKEGFRRLKPGKDYENLFQAATARAESDWLVGINGTRALTTKYNAQLSLGRVQTPTLSLISDREEAIRKFKPVPFFGVKIYVKELEFILKMKNGESRLFDEKKADEIIAAIKDKKATIKAVDKKLKKNYPDKLYDLTTLQRDAFNRYGYSPKMTLSFMQQLYEQHKALTYPRTDSRYLTQDIVSSIGERLKAIQINPYRKFAYGILKSPIRGSKSFVDDSKVSDHHAIIPTEESVSANELSFDERRIYEMVVKRFLEVLMPPSEYEETKMIVTIAGYDFETIFKNMKTLGFLALSSEMEKHIEVPDYKLNQTLPVSLCKKTNGETKPPEYFNEASLLEAMENPSKYIDEDRKELKKILSETGGLGTVATRADIIEKLYGTKLMEKKGKSIKMTKKGKQLLDLVPDDLKSPILTAQWERDLKKIENGTLNRKVFISKMVDYTIEIVGQIKKDTKNFKHDNLTNSKCPECGKPMISVDNKNGKSLVCSDRECGYRERISRVTNARCPECHKKLELRGSKDKQIFVCVCGFKENMAAFEKRKKERDKQGGKKDYINYMNNQKKKAKEERIEDNPFAKALEGLKFD
ncbi:MAG: DNA topoisomerase III [Clostridiales bacterium]|nr:DNA topoisomerase III [Clostridiales bacterium]